MLNIFNNIFYLSFIWILFVTKSWSQIPVRKGPASDVEIQKNKAVVLSDMNNISAHKAYIYAMGINNKLVLEEYKAWMDKYPENVVIPLAIGTVYYNAEMPQAKEFLLKVVAIEPKNAKVWSMLSIDAVRWGQNKVSNEYLKRAILADTSNAEYAASYLMSFENSGLNYKTKVFDFVKRFPANDRGAQALYWLAAHATNINDKINYYEDLRNLYPPDKFKWSADGMVGLADAYLQTNTGKALMLINSMNNGKVWEVRKQVATLLIQVDSLDQIQKYMEAINKINQIILPKFNYINEYIALKKAHLEAKVGNIKAAYDSLSVKYSKIPTDRLYSELVLFGKKIGKNKKIINEDIQKIRNSTAVSAYPFDLDLYTSKKKLSLNSLIGKVVLLTFWFPACGPCREEFPHFQSVINKFKGKNVAYIGINVYPEQDPYVLPFMRNTKYSFIPLRGTSDFASKNYGVQSEPVNFLIDKKGRIIFRDFSINNANRRTLELMITSLL